MILLIHGSAADHSTWSIQLASSLRERFALWAYDRRGTGGSQAAFEDATPPGGAQPWPTIEQHADDAAGLARQAPEPVWVVGSSFGSVIALDLLRRYPKLVRGAVLIEPPMAHSDDAPAGPADFIERLDLLAAEAGGEAAAEQFLRAVLGDEAFARMPMTFRRRSMRLWPQIRADSLALAAYRPRYAELAAVRAPVLLLGGERSASYFRPTLEALARALPGARLEVVKGAGHMLHAEAFRTFAELLVETVGRQGLASP